MNKKYRDIVDSVSEIGEKLTSLEYENKQLKAIIYRMSLVSEAINKESFTTEQEEFLERCKIFMSHL